MAPRGKAAIRKMVEEAMTSTRQRVLAAVEQGQEVEITLTAKIREVPHRLLPGLFAECQRTGGFTVTIEVAGLPEGELDRRWLARGGA